MEIKGTAKCQNGECNNTFDISVKIPTYFGLYAEGAIPAKRFIHCPKCNFLNRYEVTPKEVKV